MLITRLLVFKIKLPLRITFVSTVGIYFSSANLILFYILVDKTTADK